MEKGSTFIAPELGFSGCILIVAAEGTRLVAFKGDRVHAQEL